MLNDEQEEKIDYHDFKNNPSSINEDAARMFNYLIEDIFKKHSTKYRGAVIEKYLDNSREVLDRYLADNYKIIVDNIEASRKMLKHNRIDVYKFTNTIDFQVDFINGCTSHRDFLKKSLLIKLSKNPEERREFNNELYYDILDYIEEGIFEIEDENREGYWN
mgnify:CR=1 FL=1